jgi:hypothetical protein
MRNICVQLGAGVADTDLAELVFMVCAITEFSQEYTTEHRIQRLLFEKAR